MKKNLLRKWAILIVLLISFTRLSAQINLVSANTSYNQNFNSLLANGTTNDSTTLPQGWSYVETGANANAK